MKIGLFTATFLDKKLDEVCQMAASLGYQAIEMPGLCRATRTWTSRMS